MKRFVTTALSAVTGALALTLTAGTAHAVQPVSPACAAANSDGTAFTQNKRICYEDLAARGRYQEIVDRIEVQPIGLTPQEKFFLATAYFGLSNRTGAHALQCHYTVHAKALLEDFLVEREELFRNNHSFGTSDDMKYVHHATKTMTALGAVTGCEESSHTVPSIERYARRYAVERLRGLFYKTTEKDPLHEKFDAKLGQMNETMRGFVATASQIETRYGLTLIEVDSGRQYLFGIRDRINGLFGAEAVKVDAAKVGADDSFPTFAYDAAWKTQILATLDTQTAHYADLLSNGEIAQIETAILNAINQESMDGYAARKEQTILDVLALTEKVILPVSFWTEFSAPSHKGVSALQAAMTTPSDDALARTAAAQDAAWSEGMKSYCTPNTTRWYCKPGNRP